MLFLTLINPSNSLGPSLKFYFSLCVTGYTSKHLPKKFHLNLLHSWNSKTRIIRQFFFFLGKLSNKELCCWVGKVTRLTCFPLIFYAILTYILKCNYTLKSPPLISNKNELPSIYLIYRCISKNKCFFLFWLSISIRKIKNSLNSLLHRTYILITRYIN